MKRRNITSGFIIALMGGKLGYLWGLLGVMGLAALWRLVTLNPPRTRDSVDLADLDPTVKRILIWNDYWGMKHYGEALGRSIFSECRVTECELWDRHDSEVDFPPELFDAIIFHGIDTETERSQRDLPLLRTPHQRYVFLLHESPMTYPEIFDYKHFFNWTATYRRDSDVYTPYLDARSTDTVREHGSIFELWREPVFQNMSADISEIIANKSKLVAWFVSNSNTQSGREYYVAELSKYIQVDIYGRDKSLSCSRTDINCDQLLDTTYKFYLSFENSLCLDYVTEKFRRALTHNVVPVVYGGADYKVYAPPLSYINVRDFASPRALARYLHYLDKHPEEYQKYFWWKEFYKYDNGPKWCEMCEKLHDPDEPAYVYPDIASWWNHPGVCTSPQDFFKRV